MRFCRTDCQLIMIELTRQSDSLSGTHGWLEIRDDFFNTLEQPYLDNLPFRSCVPVGEYVLIPYDSPKYGYCHIMVNPELNVYQFEDSPSRPEDGRYLCLFVHRGNYVKNFKGCTGAGVDYLKDQDMITSTRETCKIVNKLVIDEGSFRLRIQ